MDAVSSQTQAQQVIQLLAQGINPITGEVLPETSPYNDPLVIRALFTILQEGAADRPPARRERQTPEMHGKPWAAEDREKLAAAFLTGEGEARLAEVFQRTRGGIRAELIHQGLIEAPNAIGAS